MTSLARKSLSAALWNYGGNAIQLALQFSIGVILARLLGPEAFGLVAIALFLVGLGQLFADFGFSAAIIQARELDDRDVDFVFTMQVLSGALLTGAGFALAGPIAAFFHEPEAVRVIRWMALIFVIRALGQTSVAMLSRELRFRAVQIGSVTGYVSGYVAVGLPLAFSGYGVWSLVAAQLVQSSMTVVMALVQAGRLPRPRLGGGQRALYHFGQQVILANLGSWTISNADSFIVGRVAGVAPLGLYNRAMNLAGVPMGAMVSGLQGVLFATVSRTQDDPGKVRKILLACIAAFILSAGSVLLAVAATSATVMTALYGARWTGAIPLLTPLALAMAVNGILAFFGPALMGIGQVAKENRAQWLAVIALLPATIAAVHVSVEAVAWTILGGYLLRLTLLAFALHGAVRFQADEVIGATLAPVAVALLAAVSAALADHWAASLQPLWRLAAAIAGGGLGLATGLFVFRRSLLTGALGELLLQSNVLPPAIASRIAAHV